MKVSVIIANRNDVEMLAVTVRSAIEELSAVPGGGEVVIVDNSDDEIYEALPALLPAGYRRGKNPKIRYFRQDYPCLFTARQKAAQEAKGDYIFCVDSHCIIGHNVIVDLVHFMNRNRNRKIGFAHAPVNWLCQWEGASRHDMKEIFGTWGKLYNDERKMSWKGMPWMCRKDWFLNDMKGYGALSDNQLAWGGGDMYLGLKSWILGYENWAVPTRPVIHIGPLPAIARKFWKYRRYQKSGEGLPGLGYLVALFAIGGDSLVYDEKFSNFISNRHGIKVSKYAETAKRMAADERRYIEKNQSMTFDEMRHRRPWQSKTVDYNDALTRYRNAVGNSQKAIKQDDWDLIKGIVESNKIKSVLEFGTGLSTMLFQSMNLDIVSVDTDREYLTKLDCLFSNGLDVRLWNNKDDIDFNGNRFDLALVDGDLPRDKQCKIAKSVADIVVVHDGRKRQCGFSASHMLRDWKEIENSTRLTRVFIKP
jgi:glycosyltransferase involved in cell wall biosynthesis